jgi:hypothetical protein
MQYAALHHLFYHQQEHYVKERFVSETSADTSNVMHDLPELLRRLDQEEEPLPKRLRLALAAFKSNDLPVQRKEEIILKWLCEYGERNRNSEDVWSVLKACFNSSRMKKLSSANIRPPVKCSISQVSSQIHFVVCSHHMDPTLLCA